MRHSGLRTDRRCEDILTGIPVLILAVLAFYLLRTSNIDQAFNTAVSKGTAFVQIDGDVRYPGVYSFDDRPSIGRLMEMSGGKRADSYRGALLPVPLYSGARIIIKRDKDSYKVFYGEISAFHRVTLGMPVSINRESEEGLTAIPGIGEGLAGIIARERIERGGFKSLEELRSIRGLGDKTYNKILPYITL